ncbi:helix-turn-helix transcriptional regulator [Colwellia sp. E2M01]|uniref:helix-turn-helix domain-containing protein n=1 Tax=Colwellia sp. E2M01 TaxID=2841561 RepID=UPI001C096F8C|nr:helix-turn-helix transcriptional regulator [Colwellia sp. E2M01]MBU2869125.1 helix-turn-helix domain-containing protein [Colwellia sp. E2M01]
MILAEKIVRLRKQFGWSQEDLAEKMNISRQSVSKWESTNSIPDLNRIIMLAEVFDVSTDFLLKDENEEFDSRDENKEPVTVKISLEQAVKYIENKMEVSALITKGVMLCVCSVIPLLFFLAMVETNRFDLTGNIAATIGVVGILVMVSIGVSFFIKINQYENDIAVIENEAFELAYGVHSVFKEKLKEFRITYNRRLSVSIFIFIISFVPLMVVSIFSGSSDIILMMLIVLFLMIALGIYIIGPVSAKYEAYNNILKGNSVETTKSKRTKRVEKLAALYWPLLTAIFLGWSLLTMNWGITWIVWPVGSVLFAALVGLMEFLDKEEL